MNVNNYTSNPNHPDVDLSISLDVDLARMHFDENFERISKTDDYLWLYTDNGNLPDEPTIVEIPITKNIKNALYAALSAFGNGWLTYIDEYTLQELAGKLTDLAFFAEDYFTLLGEHNIIYTQPYTLIQPTGYSQGDCATVVVPEDVKINSDFKEHINRLFWGAPLYFRMEIDGEGFYASDFWEDIYYYDKDEFISAFMTHHKELPEPEYIKEFLEENLPEWPEYI